MEGIYGLMISISFGSTIGFYIAVVILLIRWKVEESRGKKELERIKTEARIRRIMNEEE